MTMKVFTYISLSLSAPYKEEKQVYIPCMSYSLFAIFTEY
jgi:hypothetical protein